MIPPLGNLYDTHHDSCYRLYNVEMEMKNPLRQHTYRKEGKISLVSQEEWTRIQDAATKGI